MLHCVSLGSGFGRKLTPKRNILVITSTISQCQIATVGDILRDTCQSEERIWVKGNIIVRFSKLTQDRRDGGCDDGGGRAIDLRQGVVE